MKTTIRSLLVLLILIFFQSRINGQDFKTLDDKSGLSAITQNSGIEKPVTIRIIYDNYVKADGLLSDWGYSVVIEGLDKGILFDTGTKPDIFESNWKKMNLDAGSIDFLVLSHEHNDHTDGIPAFVKMKKGIPVVIPHSFSSKFKTKMVEYGLEPLLVSGPVKICENLYSSGEFSGSVPEQALVLNTRKGLVVMTGCSHPGIIEMLRKIKTDFNKDLYMVFGGFHLLQKSEKEMEEIISGMKTIGVQKCGATHCTGESQIKMFRDSFGSNFVELGVGNTIVIN